MQIVLRTINSSRSACMSATYACDFFGDYQLQLPPDIQGEQQHSLQSAVLMKVHFITAIAIRTCSLC